MKFISPVGIAAKMMELIDEAEKTLIIVSPYVDITKWGNMKKCLERAVKRGVSITFVMRENQTPVVNINQLTSIGIQPILVHDLHAKVYINDRYGIVTSQNMILYSDTNSIDIAYKTENTEEREELLSFVNKYVLEHAPKPTPKVIKAVPKLKTAFIKVKERNTDDVFKINDSRLDHMFSGLSDNFRLVEFKEGSNYVFSSELLPFCHVIIGSRYTIKIDKRRTDKEQIVKELECINFNFLHTFRVEHVTAHHSHIYIEFIPSSGIVLKDLIQDYINLSNSILNSKVMKVMRKQKFTQIW